jgi:uncharacterized membrane protein
MANIAVGAKPIGFAVPHIRRFGEADIRWALAEGWRDFRERRGDFLFLPLIYPLAGFFVAALAIDKSFLPMLFPVVAGLSILGPAVASGFYELARRREAGLDSSWVHFADPLRGRGRTELALLTLGLIVLFGLWLLAADLIYRATIGADGPLSLGAFVGALFGTPAGWMMILVGNLVGFVFAAVTLALAFVSFPLVVDRPVGAATAVMTSIQAVRENPSASAAWGLRVAVFLVLGCVPVFLGLTIVLPVLGFATWHLYTRVVER